MSTNTKTVYQNPIVLERADPWIYKHTDGYYYFTGSVPGYQEIELRRAKTINELGSTSEKKSVWFAHEAGDMSNLIWAPELHFLNGKWYINFAACGSATERSARVHHKMFVLENTGANPLEGEWVEKGQVKTHQESFSLDATYFEHHDELYYVWAQGEPAIPGNSNIYIAKMENPWTIKGQVKLLTIPEYDWECVTYLVNEGPAVIKRNGKVFITYSGSATDENYCMGLLWADENADLLDGYAWTKSPVPVFVSSEANSQFGPGHNSFTVSEDGTEDLLVYHARPKKNDLSNPLDNPDRHARVQAFTWNEDGMPVFGIPVADLK